MVKYFLILSNLIGVVLISFFTDQNFSISLTAPETVKAGEEFMITLQIEKGDIQSFSRFSQELPYGLTATRLNSSNADFSFEEQRVRLIWLKLPPEPTITVTYSIKVHERLKGSFTLGGEFSYIEGNDRKTLGVNNSQEIIIQPNPGIPADHVVDIKDFEKIMLPELIKNQEFGELAVIRKPPVKTGTHEITVEMLVRKKDLSKFAKIEEQLPAGFRATEGNSNGGIFSFSQGTVKLLWMNLPPQNEFIVSYKVIPDPGKKPEDLIINGSFSYISDNQTRSVGIIEKNYELAPDTVGKFVDQVADTREEHGDIKKDDPIKTDLVLVDSIVKKPGETRLVAVSGNERYLQPENGIYYRVQLAAGHKEVNPQSYFRKLKVEGDVRIEDHEGWKKYTIGSFYEYKDARDFREKIRKESLVKDAFVSAYNSGKRITVQEALMTANHKWYR